VKLASAPPNEFSEFIATYFESCRTVCPRLRVIAGKWDFADLIPGLSDFDTRFLAANDTTPEDWAAISLAVGDIHANITRAWPRWARILEHLPGVNLTFAELYDPVLYQPEIQTWTIYDGDKPEAAHAREYIANCGWTPADEYFHLRKFATYFGPYRRGIDPPINLGPFEEKYALHSRYMHYFAPPVQAAVSLALRQTVRGKLEALKRAREVFPNPHVIDTVLDAIATHYETAESCDDSKLADIERALGSYLAVVRQELVPSVTLVELSPSSSPVEFRQVVSSVPINPITKFLNTARYARLMRGRLMFYAQQIPWFDTGWLIRNELQRMVDWFCRQPLIAYREAGLEAELSAAERKAFRRLAQVVDQEIPEGAEKARAQAAADVFEPVQLALEDLADQLHGVAGRVTSL